MSARVLRDWVAENIAVVSVLLSWPLADLGWSSEDRACEGVLLSLRYSLSAYSLGCLDSATVCCLRPEDVRILVRCTSDFSSQWVVFENAFTFIYLLLLALMVGLKVEYIASRGVRVALLLIVIMHVRIWVAENICVIFSLLKVSRFCHI